MNSERKIDTNRQIFIPSMKYAESLRLNELALMEIGA